MNKLLARWLINAIAIGLAMRFVPGITRLELPENASAAALEAAKPELVTILIVALIFGLVNALVRPVLKLLTCPLILMTLGLFIFVINAAMLLLTSAIAERVGLAFHVDGIVPALIGSVLISAVSIVLSIFIPDDK